MSWCYITQHIFEVYGVVDVIRYDSHLTCSSLFGRYGLVYQQDP